VSVISASLVKQLRDVTGAGMMDCKRALEETGGDLDAARVLLRERGLASAGKKAERTTSDGLVGYIVSNGAGAILGVGSETDFVAKNAEFQAFAEKVLRAVHAEGESTVEKFEPERLELIGKLGENIVIVGVARFERPCHRRLRASAREQDRRPGRSLRRNARARTPARNAHQLGGSRVEDEGGRAGGDRRCRAGDLHAQRRGAVEARSGT